MTPTFQHSESPDYPGRFTYAKKAVVGPNAQVMSRDIRIAVDNCIGGVQIRTYATVAVSTDATDDTLTTFGKPIFLTRPEQNR